MTIEELKDFEEDASLGGWTQRVWRNSDVSILCAEIRRLREVVVKKDEALRDIVRKIDSEISATPAGLHQILQMVIEIIALTNSLGGEK